MTALTKDSSPAEWRAAWVEALRSGQYRQGTKSLRNDTRFCCLGVACDLAAKAGLGEWDAHGFGIDGEWNAADLPRPVQQMLGLTQAYGQLGHFVSLPPNDAGEHEADTLTDFNDNGGSFAEIADLIESGAVFTTDGAS